MALYSSPDPHQKTVKRAVGATTEQNDCRQKRANRTDHLRLGSRSQAHRRSSGKEATGSLRKYRARAAPKHLPLEGQSGIGPRAPAHLQNDHTAPPTTGTRAKAIAQLRRPGVPRDQNRSRITALSKMAHRQRKEVAAAFTPPPVNSDLLQPRVLGFGLLQHRDIRVGILPDSQKILIGRPRLRGIARLCIGAGQPQMCQ